MKTITLTVNGQEQKARVSPRTSLADFLREDLNLTGTHLGCEHGVCGACTVNLNGAPARACITYAIACDGANIRTIEGFDDDILMGELRTSFSENHALQCGYCTPGMMITARDIVQRLPEADEQRVRVELSGNLCRCTGYVGIVDAILEVKSKWDGRPDEIEATPVKIETVTPQPAKSKSKSTAASPIGGKMTRLEQSFTVGHPREKVWALFEDLPKVAGCMPGASLAGAPVDGHVDGSITIKLGPIRADFAGEADVENNASDYTGIIRGAGLDKGHSSKAHGEVHYALKEIENGDATQVDITIAYALTGPLAQFSRAGIVSSFVEQMTKTFAVNLETRISGKDVDTSAPVSTELNVGSLMFSVLKSYFQNFFNKLFGKT